ncbi:heparinase II/III domain-containing protein [Staphylococcus saprophyticus]|uniref:heparinase II/III domain-containing protein n=1 Tax=Staphylococcus saprophyticus TaxID=29385 RepID=UPI0036EA89A7
MIQNLNIDTVLPLLPSSKHTQKIAEAALNNKVIPFPNFDAINFDEKIWKFEKGTNTASYQLYIQSLRVVGELINYYKISKEERYLYKAVEIVDSWIEFSDKDSTEMTWYDHPTANRTQIIIELMYYMNSLNHNIDLTKYLRQLEIHCEYLVNDKNYRPNNHGLMMDRSLLCAGVVLKNPLFYIKGKSRAQQTFWHSYSYNGVHLENSPEYHLMVTKMYKIIEKYLNNNNDSLGIEINNMIKKADEYLHKIKRPNNKVPAIGDSSEIEINESEVDWNNFTDTESGITILKNKTNEIYLGFICGYSTITHKHADDLSIILNYKSQDFFVDSGKYNYSKTKSRYYLVSNKAHSSFQLKEKYEKSNLNKYKKEVWTDTYFDNKTYSLVSGYLNKYKNTFMRRTIYYLKELNLILIRDTGVSKELKNWVNRFNLNNNVEITSMAKDTMKLNIDNNFIILKCLSGQEIKSISQFENEIVEKPIISKKANKLNYTNQLISKDDNKENTDFLFIIAFNETPDIKIIKEENNLVICKNELRATLPII